MGFRATGNYTNAARLYLRVGGTQYACATDYPVTGLHGSLAPTASVNNVSFYGCLASTTYTIKLVYKYYTANDTYTEYEIPSGSYGWTNYSWRKRFSTCMNFLPDRETTLPALRTANSNETPDPTSPESNDIKNKFSFYPNPASNSIIIAPTTDVIKIMTVKILDTNKNVLLLEKLQNQTSENSIDVSKLNSGLYIIEITTNEGTFYDKLIKN